MRLVESLKQGQEKLESLNSELKSRVESTLKNWPETLNKKVSDIRNMSLPWTQYFHFFHEPDETLTIPEDKALSEKFVALRQRLEAELGEESYVGEWFQLDQRCIDQFADVTGDHQWIHTDPERAAQESPFKTTIAHGFLTLSLIPMLTDTVNPEKNDYPEARLVVNYGMNKVVFPAPVRAGKRIRARTRIIEIRELRRGLELVREVKIEVENSKRAACIAELVLRLYD
ncbi:MAG: MaoC family dehydratase [Pseudomonadota bacterium]|nr:MaoC family dehydratase [Pseudomonadota bacterium]MED5509031.1 MaoC family dehydratase [Pseudomonadota bacterium]